MYAVVIAGIDMSHDNWFPSSNIIRKVLMQLLCTMKGSLHCIKVYDCHASAIYLWKNDKLFLYLCPFY
jgi:hypothetical protein